jgi:hypothetical protein
MAFSGTSNAPLTISVADFSMDSNFGYMNKISSGAFSKVKFCTVG